MPITDEQMQRAREAVALVRLQVSSEQALRYMQTVRHKGFLKSLRSNWRIDGTGHPTIQSICWLFCWATMGNNPKNKKTAESLSTVFDRIFDHSYEWFAHEVPHKLAKKWRYARPSSLIHS